MYVYCSIRLHQHAAASAAIYTRPLAKCTTEAQKTVMPKKTHKDHCYFVPQTQTQTMAFDVTQAYLLATPLTKQSDLFQVFFSLKKATENASERKLLHSRSK